MIQLIDIYLKIFKIEIIKTEKYRQENYFIYQKVYAHENISKNYVLEQSIDGDVNCYFRNLSYFFVNNQEYHAFFRNILFQYISNNQTDI